MPDPVQVVLQTNFGSAQTGVKWQMYDQSGLYGTATSDGVTNPITGIYTIETTVAGFVGIQWTCDNASLTRQQDLGSLKLLDQIYGQIETVALLIGVDIAGLIGAVPTATENADALLNRDMSAVTVTNARSPINALRFLRNKWSISGTTLTVTKEDDTTPAWTSTLTTSASADPVTGNDPA